MDPIVKSVSITIVGNVEEVRVADFPIPTQPQNRRIQETLELGKHQKNGAIIVSKGLTLRTNAGIFTAIMGLSQLQRRQITTTVKVKFLEIIFIKMLQLPADFIQI